MLDNSVQVWDLETREVIGSQEVGEKYGRHPPSHHHLYRP
jgi:hypothetical protein